MARFPAMLFTFAVTLFAGASLLFLVEPMIGKMILPLLGGTPAVWNTCMVFFQALLLAGYAYAHATTAWLGPRRQALLHLAVLVPPLALLAATGLSVDTGLVDTSEGRNPIPGLLLLLTTTVGLPFFVVSASAPLLQKWFADTAHPAARDPYFLYGASNLGSMLALLGYPLAVEPNLTLATQRSAWCVGYALLAVLTAGCAAFLWRSAPAPVPAGPAPDPADAKAEDARIAARKRKPGSGPRAAGGHSPPTPADSPRSGAVTWRRRLRWVALGAVPSSLMLGVTTYMTTDIAAIPLLWVLPLALYLLSFIVVFSKIPPAAQAVLTWVGVACVLAAFCRLVAGVAKEDSLLLPLVVFSSLVLLVVAAAVLARRRGPLLLHHAFLVAMPLAVLLLLFLMLSDIRPSDVLVTIALHLLVLFVVAMACHGELARDRPAAGRLTEFFLWMSVGGVAGGLFNALAAPLLFNGLVEYQLALVAACFLLPAGDVVETGFTFRADLVLAAAFALVGGALLAARWAEGLPGPGTLDRPGVGVWFAAALAGAVVVGAVRAAAGGREGRAARVLDAALPVLLGLLVVGLYWGLWTDLVWPRLQAVAARLPSLDARQLRVILTYGVPAVLCYTFVERPFRFGLSVGALLLGASFCAEAEDRYTLFQERSFFGVLHVSQGVERDENKAPVERYRYNRLMHGTTLHGKQFVAPDLRDEPLTYYHRTGPVGDVFRAYNTDPTRPFGVIGLGTGTMAAYGLHGQRVTFYDIDPVVRRIAFDSDRYFTFVRDAQNRGVRVGLHMGDARLTMQGEQPAEVDKYGLLVVDAFSSDAIPVHLITWEALEMYWRHVRADGIVCFHVSNRYLDLKPVLGNFAERGGLTAYYLDDDDASPAGKQRSTWVVLARSPEHLRKLDGPGRLGLALENPDAAKKWRVIGNAGLTAGRLRTRWWHAPTSRAVGVWTDDFSNLWSVFDAQK